MYEFIKPILFKFDAERAHHITLAGLQLAYQLGLTSFLPKMPSAPREFFGLSFPNRIGLAAGMDKNADYVDALASLGFGFIEVGTVTPRPQIGNPRPRVFRLVQEEAILQWLGFNNKGVDHMAAQLEKCRYRGVLGINIGKNSNTPNDQAMNDYLYCFRRLWKYASYIAVNVSSPNTLGLRDLQAKEVLFHLLFALKDEQKNIHISHQKYVPLLVKISPDLSAEAIADVADVVMKLNIDGVIATNTTINHEGEKGGVSGKPLQYLNTAVIRQLHSKLRDNIPIIAVGGIMDKSSAQEKFAAGASLLQVYTGLIYRGPNLIRELL
jgi:dihydroorotate dehydrogenase